MCLHPGQCFQRSPFCEGVVSKTWLSLCEWTHLWKILKKRQKQGRREEKKEEEEREEERKTDRQNESIKGTLQFQSFTLPLSILLQFLATFWSPTYFLQNTKMAVRNLFSPLRDLQWRERNQVQLLGNIYWAWNHLGAGNSQRPSASVEKLKLPCLKH